MTIIINFFTETLQISVYGDWTITSNKTIVIKNLRKEIDVKTTKSKFMVNELSDIIKKENSVSQSSYLNSDDRSSQSSTSYSYLSVHSTPMKRLTLKDEPFIQTVSHYIANSPIPKKLKQSIFKGLVELQTFPDMLDIDVLTDYIRQSQEENKVYVIEHLFDIANQMPTPSTTAIIGLLEQLLSRADNSTNHITSKILDICIQSSPKQEAEFDNLGIPENFEVGQAVGGGDCFFDAVAQGLKQLNPNIDFDIESLRKVCKELIISDQQSSEEVRSKVLRDARNSYDLAVIPPDNNVSDNDLWCAYLAGIEYTAKDMDEISTYNPSLHQSITSLRYGSTLRVPIWGRPDIEGWLICKKYTVSLHLIEKSLSASAGFVNEVIDQSGSRSVGNDVDYNEPDTIHVINRGRGHFEPILRKTKDVEHVKQQSSSDSNSYEVTNEKQLINTALHTTVHKEETEIVKFLDLNTIRKDFKQRCDETKKIFSTEKEPCMLLPISERHYLILKGKLRGQNLGRFQDTSQSVEFPRVVNEVVRNIISNFNKPEDIQSNNLLFYIIHNPNKKKLKVLVAASGFGKSGQKGFTEEHTQCEDKLITAITKFIQNSADYSVEGIFIPFSKQEDRFIANNQDTGWLFYQLSEKLENLNTKQHKFVKSSLIEKLLRGPSSSINAHTIRTILQNTPLWPSFIADLNKAKEIYGKLIDKIKTEEKSRNKKDRVDIEQFTRSITLELLDKIAQKEQMAENTYNCHNIQENIEFLEGQSRIIHFNDEYKTKINDFLRNNKEYIVEYEQSLEKVWKLYLDNANIFDVIRYGIHCSEDNLIDYLSYNSDILKEEGLHYIFSVLKKQIPKKTESTISINPPCSYCILHFPLEFGEIAKLRVGLPTFKFKEYAQWPSSIEDLSFNDQQFSHLPEVTYQNLKKAALYGSTELVEHLIKNDVTIEYSKIETAIHYAIIGNHKETVEALLELAAKKNEGVIVFEDSITPFHRAASYKRPDIFNLLVTKIPDEEKLEAISAAPKIEHPRRGRDIYTPLQTAICSSNIEMVKNIWEWQKGKIAPREETIEIERFSIQMTPLHSAAIRGDYEIVEYLVEEGFLIEDQDFYNYPPGGYQFDPPATALRLAITNGFIEVSKFLLAKMEENGMQENIRRTIQSKHLGGKSKNAMVQHQLSGYGAYDDGEIIKKLLSKLNKKEKEDAVNAKTSAGLTPLHYAAAFGHEKVVKVLLENGANVDVADNLSWTPLHCASQGGYENVVDFLIQSGACVNYKNNVGEIPLHFAAGHYHLETAEILLQNGGNIEARNHFGWLSLSNVSCRSIASVVRSTRDLFDGIKGNDLRKIESSIREGGCVGATDSGKTGFRTLHYAADHNNVRVIKILLQNAIEQLNLITLKNFINARAIDSGSTALHFAAQKSNLEIVKLLLQSGAIYNLKNKKNKTPSELTTSHEITKLFCLVRKLFEGVKRGDDEQVTQLLEEEKVIINSRDDNCGTPLYWSISQGYMHTAHLLLNNGADYTLVTSKGNTPLHIASSRGNNEIVVALLEKVKNNHRKNLNNFINAQTIAGGTSALHIASSVEIAKSLLGCGAIYNIKNKEGKLPLDLAKNDEIRNLLNLTHELFVYVKNGNNEIIDKLSSLECEEPEQFTAVTNARNEQGYTIQEVAIAKGVILSHDKIESQNDRKKERSNKK